MCLTAGQKREQEPSGKRNSNRGQRVLADGPAQLLGGLRQFLAVRETVAALLVEVRSRRGGFCGGVIEMGLRGVSPRRVERLLGGAFSGVQRLLGGALGAVQSLLRSL